MTISGLRIFVCTDFKGHYPVGAAAVVTAFDEESALGELGKALRKGGLEQPNGFTVREIQTMNAEVHILCDGNY